MEEKLYVATVEENNVSYKGHVFLTGDTHGSFDRIEEFCYKVRTTKEDLLIILGDAGINYHGDWLDRYKKELLSTFPITVLCIHGNHERRPDTIETYREKEWNGGTVFVEDNYPSILFAKDGEVYDLNGRKVMVIGGAYSIDKAFRVRGKNWWPDEQPSLEIKRRVERRLKAMGWCVDVVLTHTCPLKYEPVEVFIRGVDQSKVDKSTEIWLDKIENRLKYEHWYCGHYHTTKQIDRVQFMFEDFDELASNSASKRGGIP